jgi:hypothetical protein
MIFAIDHIVLAATRDQRASIAGRLGDVGFVAESFTLDFPESGVASDSWSFRSGAFVELVSERDREREPARWFDRAPRVIGLGFASDAFESDASWSDDPGAWTMDEAHVLPDGSRLRIRAAGPHEHESDVYVFVMDRPDGGVEFAPRPQAPHLTRVRLAGADAPAWQERLARWLALPVADGMLRVGRAQLAFVDGSTPGVRASLAFASATAPLEIALADGHIRIARDHLDAGEVG